MIWFSSDWHLGHTNIASPKVSKWPGGYRNFDSVKEMDETIIESMNKHMAYGDILYYLGDFCLGNLPKVKEYRSRILVEQIHFIKGNHDKWAKKLLRPPGWQHESFKIPVFSSLQDVLKITENGQTIFMSHYGHRVWPHSHKGCIHLYGHSHSNLPSYGKSMDVGIDAAYAQYGEYRPFSFDEIIKIMSSYVVEKPDHHGNRPGED